MMKVAMPASRSLIALLVGTVAFFALWMTALKPSSSSSTGGTSRQGLGTYQSAINKAKGAVQTSAAGNAAENKAANQVSGGGSSSTGAPSTSPSVAHPGSTPSSTSHKTATSTTVATKPARHAATPASRLSTVQHAMAAHKVLAMLFFNPAAADDRAVKQELASIPTHRSRVIKLMIPLAEASSYTAVTQQVPVNLSPTLVLIDPTGQAGEIVGFSDRFEIAQRVADALAGK